MNDCHHGRERNIMYNDVNEIRDDCVRVKQRVDAAHEEYEQWMRREPVDSAAPMPDGPPALVFPQVDVPIVQDLAAFTADSTLAETTEDEERLTQDLLGGHATYALNTHNLGFAAVPYSHVLVDTTRDDIADNSLVIALHGPRTYARRFLRSSSALGMAVLASDAQNPLKRPPTIFLPRNEVRLLQIVGILFGDSPAYARASDEAWPVDAADLIAKVRICFKVRGDSAIPLALPGQMVLGGDSLTPADISRREGDLVAVATGDGAALKRIGQAVPGFPHVRVFESIGGLGESMLVRVEESGDDFSDVPLMLCAREIVGVLYTTAGTL
jgi:hypothetical protein